MAGRGRGFLLLALALAVFALSGAGRSAVLYKDYEIHKAFGEDILCDAYVVQKGDHIIELLRLRGQISAEDFPEFLSIFKAINPHITDVNRIFPGQFLLIPLKKLPPGSLPEQDMGSVTLPLVTSQVPEDTPAVKPEDLIEHYEKYTVKRGDTLSGIMSPRFGGVGSPSYLAAIERFKELNPNIENVNRIYAGQRITLPKTVPMAAPKPGAMAAARPKAAAAARPVPKPGAAAASKTPAKPEAAPKKKPRSTPKFDPTPRVEPLTGDGFQSPVALQDGRALEEDSLAPTQALKPAPLPGDMAPAPEKASPEDALEPLKGAISALGGMVMDQGYYYFPRMGKEDLKLDLEKHPVIRLPDGRFMMLGEQTSLTREEQKAVTDMWGRVDVFDLPPQATPGGILGDVMAKAGLSPDKVDLSFFDGNVEVTVNSHLVLPGQGRYQYVAVTWLEDPKEFCHPDIVRYFADNAIKIADILPEGAPQVAQDAPKNEKHADTALQLLLDHPSPRMTIAALMKALGADYKENSPFSFPYAGFEVETVVNRLKTKDGREVLIDFGTMGGEAHDTIRKMGFEVYRITKMDDALNGCRNMARELRLDFMWDPEYLGANRSRDIAPILKVPGLLIVEGRYRPVLVTDEPLHDMITAFLVDKGVSVILVKQ
ncbi:LysM domain-containing protein [Desulfatibacillum alkenivorans DSM 16219]|jgi:LysM repeat protein|uniref:LysM domain-containing protein n=1 Tax=Desulfatibacillum alkenivorans DSM 16219 TaxID=1121393 RepID=A0A1M6KPQ1_9BACT|nr:LysM peptidoglycan-binding domain-containing protein [Desulfatibacillum alkenivorans]SHJ60872.1 LysM domain-containing protein [Desulfatibacillum alkenivorans DSM 16219]